MTTAILMGLTASAAFTAGYILSAMISAGRCDVMRAHWHEQGRRCGLIEGADAPRPRRLVALEWAEARIPRKFGSN